MVMSTTLDFRVVPDGENYRIEENLGSGTFYPWDEEFPTADAANERLVEHIERITK